MLACPRTRANVVRIVSLEHLESASSNSGIPAAQRGEFVSLSTQPVQYITAEECTGQWSRPQIGFVVFRMFYKLRSIYSVIATFYYVSIFQVSKVVLYSFTHSSNVTVTVGRRGASCSPPSCQPPCDQKSDLEHRYQ